MKKIIRTTAGLAAGFGLAGFLALGAALPAHATPGPQSSGVIISSGANGTGAVSLSDFSTYVLGNPTMPTAVWGIDPFTDARGTGPGWHILMTMSQLTSTTANTLPVGSITISTKATVASGLATGITFAPLNTVLDIGAVSLVSAAGGSGMGTFTFTPMTVTLTVPVTAKIDTYTSNAAVSTVATP